MNHNRMFEIAWCSLATAAYSASFAEYAWMPFGAVVFALGAMFVVTPSEHVIPTGGRRPARFLASKSRWIGVAGCAAVVAASIVSSRGGTRAMMRGGVWNIHRDVSFFVQPRFANASNCAVANTVAGLSLAGVVAVELPLNATLADTTFAASEKATWIVVVREGVVPSKWFFGEMDAALHAFSQHDAIWLSRKSDANAPRESLAFRRGVVKTVQDAVQRCDAHALVCDVAAVFA